MLCKNKKSLHQPGFAGLLLVLSLLASFTGCKKPSEPPQEIQARYFTQATIFCQTMVRCMQEDMRKRLADAPQRRDLVLSRMNKEVCHKTQIKAMSQLHLLGSLEADPRGPQIVAYDAELYRAYGNCTQVLSSATDCNAVHAAYNNHPDCRKVRPSGIADANKAGIQG